MTSRAAWGCGGLLLLAVALGPVVGDHAAFRYTGTGLAALAALWWLRSPGSVAAPLSRASFAVHNSRADVDRLVTSLGRVGVIFGGA